MSSTNSFYTFQYVQPDEYHFSHDSVFLARFVFEFIRDNSLKPTHILDLCAGCGIVGMDLLFHLNQEKIFSAQTVDFLEVQSIYADYFEKNKLRLLGLIDPRPQIFFKEANYNQIKPSDKKYDLIVANPPYFRQSHGVLSQSDFKNRCRFFIDSDFENLIRAIEFSLHEKGSAFILLKSLKEHGVDLETEFLALASPLEFKKIGVIRDTDLYQIKKPS